MYRLLPLTLLVALGLLVAMLMTAPAVAATLNIEAERIDGPGWVISNPTLTSSADGSLEAAVGTLEVAGEPQVESLRLQCARLQQSSDGAWRCQQASLSADPAAFQPLQLTGDLRFSPASTTLKVDGMVDAGPGSLKITGSWQPQALALELVGHQLDAVALASAAPLPEGAQVSVSAGSMNITARIRQENQSPWRVQFDASGQQLAFDAAGGDVGAADLEVSVGGSFAMGASQTTFDLNVALAAGEVLLGPLYFAIDEQPLSATATGALQTGGWRLDQFAITEKGTFAVQGSASGSRLPDWSLEQGRVDISTLQFPAAYDRYLQSVAQLAGFGGLTTAGQASGSLGWQSGKLVLADLDVEALDLDDAQERFSVTGLNGQIHWGVAAPASLSWQSARVLAMKLGEATLAYRSADQQVALRMPVTIPVFDGSLDIEDFRLDFGGDQLGLDFRGQLHPVSLGQVSTALGWPSLAGSLSGRIPQVTLADGVLRVGGRLLMKVFDGQIAVSDLTMERPLGVLPTLAANVEATDLDLAVLTETFDFGRITGTLEATVENLRLLNWTPVRFDAQLGNPKDDPRRHKISQRAVENLSSLGGSGAAGALSRGFLGIFDDFSYDRLALGCQLRGNVCQMSGVGPAPNGGYYIVKGAGLPRVDVIAYQRRVDWPTLVGQLAAAAKADGAVVE